MCHTVGIRSWLYHSHKKRNDSLETQTVLIEIFICYIEIYRAAQNTGDHLKKNGFEGSKLSADDFRPYLDETNADMLVDI